ncbi:MAG: hypothetical protein QMD01_06840 [Thermodesulfovibrionales bacterium]|nr:hypothetical protein [Thermodesulfovibrionales bacterium]
MPVKLTQQSPLASVGDDEKAHNYYLKLSEMDDAQGDLGIARIKEKQGKHLDTRN